MLLSLQTCPVTHQKISRSVSWEITVSNLLNSCSWKFLTGKSYVCISNFKNILLFFKKGLKIFDHFDDFVHSPLATIIRFLLQFSQYIFNFVLLKMILQVLLSFFLCLTFVIGYRSGPPTSACESLKPGHVVGFRTGKLFY